MRGQRYPFSNIAIALNQIHAGAHMPYSCGAGGGYFGVSAEGELYACHRFVDSDQGHMGDIFSGVSVSDQARWLSDRYVLNQKPCSTCWARFLCGGGCHHEVINRGRPACDFIRGWLRFCLSTYLRTLKSNPEYYSYEKQTDTLLPTRAARSQ